MKKYLFLLIFPFLLACDDDDDTDREVERFQVTVNPKLDALNIVESGRQDYSDSIYLTDYSYTLLDENCNEIDSEGRMFDGELPTVVIPNLEAGTYYYSLTIQGQENIRYDTAASFTLSSDTTIDAYVQNRQMRFRFDEISEFDAAEVYYVTYFLNYDNMYWYIFDTCPEPAGYWSHDEFDGYIDATAYSEYDTDFRYSNPIDLTSVQVKFYNNDSQLIQSHIIDIDKALKVHHSYTFEINLDAIWSGNTSGNYIDINIVDVEWTEETVELN